MATRDDTKALRRTTFSGSLLEVYIYRDYLTRLLCPAQVAAVEQNTTDKDRCILVAYLFAVGTPLPPKNTDLLQQLKAPSMRSGHCTMIPQFGREEVDDVLDKHLELLADVGVDDARVGTLEEDLARATM